MKLLKNAFITASILTLLSLSANAFSQGDFRLVGEPTIIAQDFVVSFSWERQAYYDNPGRYATYSYICYQENSYPQCGNPPVNTPYIRKYNSSNTMRTNVSGLDCGKTYYFTISQQYLSMSSGSSTSENFVIDTPQCN